MGYFSTSLCATQVIAGEDRSVGNHDVLNNMRIREDDKTLVSDCVRVYWAILLCPLEQAELGMPGKVGKTALFEQSDPLQHGMK